MLPGYWGNYENSGVFLEKSLCVLQGMQYNQYHGTYFPKGPVTMFYINHVINQKKRSAIKIKFKDFSDWDENQVNLSK